jgi:DNA repair exonuclease SbcCD ATPase subunit
MEREVVTLKEEVNHKHATIQQAAATLRAREADLEMCLRELQRREAVLAREKSQLRERAESGPKDGKDGNQRPKTLEPPAKPRDPNDVTDRLDQILQKLERLEKRLDQLEKSRPHGQAF